MKTNSLLIVSLLFVKIPDSKFECIIRGIENEEISFSELLREQQTLDVNVVTEINFILKPRSFGNVLNFTQNSIFPTMFTENFYISIHPKGDGKGLEAEKLNQGCWKITEHKINDLEGVKLIAIIADEPQTAHTVTNDGEIVLTGGIGTEIFHCFRDVLKFSYDVIVENDWPRRLPNGSWVGIGKILMEHRGDIAIVFINFIQSRVEAFTILQPHVKDPLVAAFYQPPWQSVRNVYLFPFSNSAWYVAVLMLVAFLAFLWLFKATHKKSAEVEMENDDEKLTILLWLLSQICQQGWFPFTHRQKFSIKLICWIIAPLSFFLLLSYYEAALYTFLSAPNIPIKNIRDLLQSNFHLVADNYSYSVLHLLQGPQFSTSGKYDKRIVFKHVKDSAVDLISRNAAIITFPHGLLVLGEEELCGDSMKLNLLPFPVAYPQGMMMPKNSPYKEIFNIRLTNLMESGLLKRFLRNSELPGPRCLHPEVNSFQGIHKSIELSMSDLFPAFLIFSLGFVIAPVVFVVEKCGM